MEKDRTFFTAQDIHSKLDPKKLNNLNVSDDRFAFVSWNQEKNKNITHIVSVIEDAKENAKINQIENASLDCHCFWEAEGA